MKDIFKLGFVLFFVCSIAAFLLGVTNELTKGPIADNIAQANLEARQEVFEKADNFKLIAVRAEEGEYPEDYAPHASSEMFLDEQSVVTEVYEALDASETKIGYVILTKPNGYGGSIDVIIGFDLEGVITGVRVGDHQETPGLGAKAKLADFYDQYIDLKADGTITVIKEDVAEGMNAIKAITSATITSSAVTDGVNLSKLVLDTFK